MDSKQREQQAWVTQKTGAKMNSGFGTVVSLIQDIFGGRKLTWDDLYRLYDEWDRQFSLSRGDAKSNAGSRYNVRDPGPFDVWVQKQGRVDPELVDQFLTEREKR